MLSNHVELSLRKCVAPEFIFGVGARHLVGTYTKNLGATHPLVVTDAGVVAAGWLKDVTDSLEKSGIAYTVFQNVIPNPRDINVHEGAKLYEENGCDSLVVVGGGSPVDCAKGIGIIVSNQGNILDYEGVDKILFPLPPLICIPTTAGASADVSQFAIINDTDRKVKIAIISKSIVPDLSLIDPETTLTMDFDLTVNTGLDVLTHAFEAYASNASSSITDLYALEAITLLQTNLPKVAKNLQDIEARGSVMMASLLAGLAFSNASLGAVHAMAHSLGGWLDLPHGLCNAILLNHVVKHNFPFAPERYKRIANTMGIVSNLASTDYLQDEFCKYLVDFKESLNASRSLSSLGVQDDVIPRLSSMALNDACIVTNPKLLDQHEVEDIYGQAL